MDKEEKQLEIYKLHSELADRVSQRRSQTNQYFIALISALVTGLAFLAELKDFDSIVSLLILLGVSIFGIILCYVWIINIESYRQLNSGKFKTLHELEQELPFNFYERELEHLGKGENKEQYKKLSEVEKNVPRLLMTPFIIGIIVIAIKLIIKTCG